PPRLLLATTLLPLLPLLLIGVALREAQAEPGERLRVVERLGAAERAVQKAAQIDARDLLERLAQLGRRVAAVARVARERETAPVVEARLACRRRADARVEQEGDDRPLRVVADRRVRRVLVAPVVLDPGVARRSVERLY